MERTWKKTLAAGIAAVAIVVALVLAGGRLTDHTAPADQGSSAMQQTDADRQQEQTLDPDDPDVVGPKQNGNREGTGSTTGNSGGQDQYHTDPVPEGRPQSVEPGSTSVDTDTRLTCTISISCATILDNMDLCAENKLALVPSDGVILPAEVLYDLFLRRAQPRLIQLLRDAVAVRLRLCAVGDCRTAQHCLVFLLLCLPGEMGRRRHSLPQL